VAKKLCDWSSKRIKKKEEEFKKLVRNPGFFCRSCGRASAEKKALCKPEALD
jgi:hypothetical protein